MQPAAYETPKTPRYAQQKQRRQIGASQSTKGAGGTLRDRCGTAFTTIVIDLENA